ncbi:MAG: RDD family protein [Streptosporangiales bacterium]|nr:RDD family protein [Streptosporangiales bacterium]
MADVVTGEAVVLDVQAARLASRVLAFAIDLMIQVTMLFLLAFLIVGASVVADPALLAAISLVVDVGVIVGYPVLCESLWRGRTPGKAALGLRVVSEDGGPERFRQALFRALAAFVEIWLLFGSVAIIASLLSRQGRRLGDVFAGTLVIRERVPVRGGPLPSMPPALANWAIGLELAGLPDDVALTARQYIARYAELAPEVRDEMGRRIATTVALHVSPAPPPHTHPLAYLSAVLAERRRREAQRLHARFAPVGLPEAPRPHAAPPPQTPPAPGGFAPPS